MLGLDTSIVVRLIIGEPQPLYAAARQQLESALEQSETVVVCDLVIGEAYYALQHHYQMPKDEALHALRRFLKSGVVEPHPTTAHEALVTTKGAGLLDRLIHLRYTDIGATTHTFDGKQARLKGAVRLKA
jgi:predicted nucleic acid-binding protein